LDGYTCIVENSFCFSSDFDFITSGYGVYEPRSLCDDCLLYGSNGSTNVQNHANH